MLSYKDEVEKYYSLKGQTNKEAQHISSSSDSYTKDKNKRKRSYAEVLTSESSNYESSSESEKTRECKSADIRKSLKREMKKHTLIGITL